MKKLKYLLMLPFLALSSCGPTSLYGTYAFAMGNEKTSHIGLYATLSETLYTPKKNEVVPNDDTVTMREFRFYVDLPSSDEPEAANAVTMSDIANVSSILSEGASEGSLAGYWYEGEDVERGKRINIGIEEFDKIFEEILKIATPQIIEKIVVAYVAGKNLDIYIPVSLVDLQMQLCWYGYFVSILTPSPLFVNLYEKLDYLPGPYGKPGENHDLRVGTVPTADQVVEFNQIIERHPTIFGTNFKFRGQHVVRVGLTKI